MLDAADDGGNLGLKFTQYSAMPGGHLKFCILHDHVSNLFWATSNLSADSQGIFDWAEKGQKRGSYKPNASDQRFLMLHYSLDGLNWFPAGCVAQAARISQSFMYARPILDGDDLAIIARSSIHAPNQHDADYSTFHRVRNFRHLALNLMPEPEEK